ncbi:hypothetical protein ACVWZ3_007608 [Bradyrhizobium sp. i1.3.6]
MDRSAADMTDVETRTLGRVLHDGLAGLNAARAARCLVAVAALLLVLITLDPFPDLRNEDVTTVVGGRMALTYISWGLLAAVAMLFVAATDAPALKSLVTPLHLCLVGWLLINIVFSESRGVSIQRFVLAVSVTSLAMLLPLLPPTQRTFNLCLGGAALVLLVLCYLGVFLAPQYSMHTALDLTEPQLAGDWRGSFGHKNIASPVMTILVYVGIYLCGVGSFVMGPAIAALAGIFLIYTGGKTSTVLCLAIYALASLVYATPGLWLKRLICFVPLIVMNLLTGRQRLEPGARGADAAASPRSHLHRPVRHLGIRARGRRREADHRSRLCGVLGRRDRAADRPGVRMGDVRGAQPQQLSRPRGHHRPAGADARDPRLRARTARQFPVGPGSQP